MNRSKLCVWSGLFLGWIAGLSFEQRAAGEPWKQYSNVADVGWSSERLEEARKFADSIGSTAVVVAYRGNLLAAWGEVERPVEIHSVRKSIFSGLFGIHASAGRVDLNATLEQLGIDDDPPLTQTEKQAKVVDLLRSRSGVYHTAAKEPSDMRSERPVRGSHLPGEYFWYNNWDFNTLGPILEKATGKKVADELYSRIVTPLGMEDFRPEHACGQLEPSYSIHPAYDFHISARDLARYGQLFVHKGEWNGSQIIPAAWIKESTAMQSTLPDGGGYGYMWWIYPKGAFRSEEGYESLNKYDKFYARGTGGQFLLVIPEVEFVFAHTADTANNREVRGPKIWKTAEMILAGRTGNPAPDAALTEIRPLRFSNPPPPIKERKAVALDPKKFQTYVGEYAVEGMHVRVFEFNQRLFANLRGVGEAELFAESDTQFFIKSDEVVIQFNKDDSGAVTDAKIAFAGKTSTLPKIK